MPVSAKAHAFACFPRVLAVPSERWMRLYRPKCSIGHRVVFPPQTIAKEFYKGSDPVMLL